MSDHEERTHEEKVQDDLDRESEDSNAAVIHLAEAAKYFLNSDLAGYIKREAELKVHHLQMELEDVDPTNFREVTRLQVSIKLYKNYDRVFDGIVAAGDTAYQLYLEEARIDQE